MVEKFSRVTVSVIQEYKVLLNYIIERFQIIAPIFKTICSNILNMYSVPAMVICNDIVVINILKVFILMLNFSRWIFHLL